MKRVWTLAIALSVGAFGAYGCDGDEETPEDRLLKDLDVFQTEVNEQVDVICDCWDEFTFEGGVTYGSKDECKTGRGEILPARRRCIDDAFKQDVTVSQQWLNCILPLEEEFTTCANDKLTCDDGNSLMACSSDYTTGEMDCLTLPNSVIRDYEDCFN